MVVFGALYVENGEWRGGGGDIPSITYITCLSTDLHLPHITSDSHAT